MLLVPWTPVASSHTAERSPGSSEGLWSPHDLAISFHLWSLTTEQSVSTMLQPHWLLLVFLKYICFYYSCIWLPPVLVTVCGIFCWSAQTLHMWHRLQSTWDSVAATHGFSCSMACGILVPQPVTWTHVPCIARQILDHWTTREVPGSYYFNKTSLFLPIRAFAHGLPAAWHATPPITTHLAPWPSAIFVHISS